MCSHREPAWQAERLRHPLAFSEAAQDRCILLPLYPGMTTAELRQVVDALITASGNNAA